MRVAACLLPALLVVGCGSETSSRKDATPPDGAPVPSLDGPVPDLGTDPVPGIDQAVSLDTTGTVPTPDTAPAAEVAPRLDLARADVPGPSADLVNDASADLGPGPAADAPFDYVATPDAPPKGDVDPGVRPDLIGRKRDAAFYDSPPDVHVEPIDAQAIDAASIDGEADAPLPLSERTLGGCPILPANHIFNTPIADLPTHLDSEAFIATIGDVNIHLDLGTTTDPSSSEYYGIPYNVVNSNAMAWAVVSYSSTDPGMTWAPREESDCVDLSSAEEHTLVSPCLVAQAPMPWLPIPTTPLVEGGIVNDPSQPYGDHHILIIDSDTCRLWELYHCYPNASNGWDIFGSATWDLGSNALRPAGWTSADAAGFPILPLLLLASEASSGEIKHALRFTIPSGSIRQEYVWPARHLTTNGTSSSELPPMGQLFRLKASYQIPSSYGTQSRAILQALKTYGMYLADGGSSLFIQGEPSAAWQESTFDEVQSVGSDQFEAVELAPLMARPGFDPDSAAVPAP